MAVTRQKNKKGSIIYQRVMDYEDYYYIDWSHFFRDVRMREDCTYQIRLDSETQKVLISEMFK